MKKGTMGSRKTILLIVAAMLISLLAACGGQQNGGTPSGSPTNSPSNSGSNEKSETPADISVMMAFWSKEPPRKGEAIEAIEAYTNANLNITWVPASGYDEKLNATIASGTHPKVLVVNDLKSSVIVSSVQAGMFWELGPYLDSYTNLSNINKTALTNTSIDGKVFGLPRERVLARNGLIIRQDWLDQLDLKPPTNLDELYEVMKAFANDDPDNNGQNDTLGLTEDSTLWIFDYVLGMLGGYNQWKVESDGSFTPAFTEPTYLEAMDFVKKLVDEGLMNQDFAIYPNRDADFNSSKTGLIFSVLDSSISASYSELRKLNPDAELSVISRTPGSDNYGIIGGSGSNGAFMIPKTSVKTEEELHQVLTFMDRLMDPEMRELFTWGLEGTHFEKNGDTYEFTNKDGYLEEVDPLTQFVFMGYNFLYTQQAQSELGDTVAQMWNDNEEIAIMNPAQPYISTTEVERGGELKKMITDARVKYILGDIDLSGWQQAIEQWRSSGGDQVAKEYAEAHANLSN